MLFCLVTLTSALRATPSPSDGPPPGPPPIQLLDCGSTGSDSTGSFSAAVSGFSSGNDACRAAEVQLVARQFASSHAACVGCPDNALKCFERIVCGSTDCSALAVGSPFEFPADSGLFACGASYQDTYAPSCSDC